MEQREPHGRGTAAPARLVRTAATTGAVIGGVVGLAWAGLAVGVLQGPPVIAERGVVGGVLSLTGAFGVFALVGAVALALGGAVTGSLVGAAAARGVGSLPLLGGTGVAAVILVADPYRVARGFTLAVTPPDLGAEAVVGLVVPLLLGTVAAAYHAWAMTRLASARLQPAVVADRRAPELPPG